MSNRSMASRRPSAARRAASRRRRLSFEQLSSRVVLSAGGLSPALPFDGSRLSIDTALASATTLRHKPEPAALDGFGGIGGSHLAPRSTAEPWQAGPGFANTNSAARPGIWDAPPSFAAPTPTQHFVAIAAVPIPRLVILVVSNVEPPATSAQSPASNNGFTRTPSLRDLMGYVPLAISETPAASDGMHSVPGDDAPSGWHDGIASAGHDGTLSAFAFSTVGNEPSLLPRHESGANAQPQPDRDARDGASVDREGGLIELEGSPTPGLSLLPDKEADDAEAHADTAGRILEWLWAELGEAWELAADAETSDPDNVADRESADRDSTAEVAKAEPPVRDDLALVEGLIELDAADVQPADMPTAAAIVESESTRGEAGVAAGVAVFQAFELATPADAVPLPTAADEHAASELPPGEEHAAADEGDLETSRTSKALTGAGLLAALPVSLRKLRRRKRERQHLYVTPL